MSISIAHRDRVGVDIAAEAAHALHLAGELDVGVALVVRLRRTSTRRGRVVEHAHQRARAGVRRAGRCRSCGRRSSARAVRCLRLRRHAAGQFDGAASRWKRRRQRKRGSDKTMATRKLHSDPRLAFRAMRRRPHVSPRPEGKWRRAVIALPGDAPQQSPAPATLSFASEPMTLPEKRPISILLGRPARLLRGRGPGHPDR